MNKRVTLTIVMIICAVIVIGALVMSMSGVVKNVFNGLVYGGGMVYENAEKYTAGEAVIQDSIRNLDIDWINGEVKIAYQSDHTIELKETSNKEISEDLKLRWWLDGDTLRIRFAKSGFRSMNLRQQKQLTVTLPEDLILGNVVIDVTSAYVNVPALNADSLELDATSGDLNVQGNVKTVAADTTSGHITLTMLAEEMDSIQVEATSGDIKIEAQDVQTIRVSSTSGKINVTAQQSGNCKFEATSGNISVNIASAEDVLVDTTSGKIDVVLGAFNDLDIEATSGDVNLTLPQQPGFSARIDTTSGQIDYEIPLSKQGSVYVVGDGPSQVRVDTTSGNVHLK